MRNRFGLLLVLVLGVIGFGFYRGWFALSSSNSAMTSHQIDFKLTMDPDKMKADVTSVKQEASDLTTKATK